MHRDLIAAYDLDERDVDLAVLDAQLEAGVGPAELLDEPLLLESVLAGLPDYERRGDDEARHAPTDPFGTIGDDDPLEAVRATAWPIARDCSARYRARRHSGTRKLATIRLGVVHCTEGSTAAGAAAWFANDASRGSAHLCVDGRECYRTLPPGMIPWGAPGVNGAGWHLELAGFARRSRAEWLAHRGTLERGAFKLAQNGRGRFPMRFLTDRQLAAAIRGDKRVRGVCSHKQVSRVYGGTHWDPGPAFPWDVFMALARKYERQLAAV